MHNGFDGGGGDSEVATPKCSLMQYYCTAWCVSLVGSEQILKIKSARHWCNTVYRLEDC